RTAFSFSSVGRAQVQLQRQATDALHPSVGRADCRFASLSHTESAAASLVFTFLVCLPGPHLWLGSLPVANPDSAELSPFSRLCDQAGHLGLFRFDRPRPAVGTTRTPH